MDTRSKLEIPVHQLLRLNPRFCNVFISVQKRLFGVSSLYGWITRSYSEVCKGETDRIVIAFGNPVLNSAKEKDT